MSCRFDKEILQKYIDNTIDPLEYIFLKEHLAYCNECKTELELLNALDSSLDGIFRDSIDVSKLDLLAEGVMDKCLAELEVKASLGYRVKRSFERGKEIAGYSVSFAGYIPGSRLLKKGITAAAGKVNRTAKAYIKSSVQRVLENNGLT